jgi:RND family efflux transporter MFP subunit
MSKKTIITILLISGGGVLIVAVILAFVSMESGAGQPVPAPRTVNFDSDSADATVQSGEVISIQLQQVRNAGITVVASTEVITTESAGKTAVGVVETNAYRDVPLGPVSQSRVIGISVELGQQVKAGQILARMESRDFANAQATFITARSELDSARISAERAVKIAGIGNDSRKSFEEARRDSLKAKALLDQASALRDRSERLFGIGAVSRQSLDEATRNLIAAKAEFEEALRRSEREAALLEINDASRSRIEESERRLRAAEGQYSEARRRLAIYGLTDSQISGLKNLQGLLTDYPLRAPIDGEVTLRSLNIGELIEEGRTVLRVTDLDSVWVVGQFAENELSQIRLGAATGIARQFGGEILASGRVTYISPSLNPSTRTTQVRVEIPNDRRSVQIGSYVRIILNAGDGSKRSVPAVPDSAVQILKGDNVVFVQKSETEFEVRSVKPGRLSNGLVPILEGLSMGEKVVSQGSFLLRAEYLKRFQ